MKPPPFRYECPRSLAEAFAVLAEHGDEARPLAGGQSLVPMLNLRLAAPAVVVDLNRLVAAGAPGPSGLGGISAAGGELAVGALVRQRALERHPSARAVGALADGLPLVGHVATRNRGTIGGSVAHADPAAEVPLALLALDGEVLASSAGGSRRIPAAEFFAGFLSTTLRPGELVTGTRFRAAAPGEGSALVEVANRHGDFALAAAACWVRVDAAGRPVEGRVAVGAVADRPLLVPEAAEALVADGPGAAGRAAAAAVEPVGSLHAPADYQRHLTGVLVERAARRAVERAAR